MGYNAGLTYSYGYLSDGTKTSADSGSGSTAQGLRYRGSFVYEILGGELERLQSISWPEGRIALEYDGNDTEPCLVSYDWLVTDHLGSVRAIAGMRTGSTGVKEVNGYLPFGTRLPGTLQSSGNRHRFGGKEEQRIGSTDLKLLDFGARYYDAFACRWTSLDPMAWKYPAITPYSYCAGNPVNLVDPLGREGVKFVDDNGQKTIESNIVILVQAQREIPDNASEKQIKRIKRYNKRIAERNQEEVNAVKQILDYAFNRETGGSYNSNGELVHFIFNVIPVETNDLNNGNDNSLLETGAKLGIPATYLGGESVALAPVITQLSTQGYLGLFLNGSISIQPNALNIALPHEVGHSFWLGDTYYNDSKGSDQKEGGLMSSPPGWLNPSEVDKIWKYAKLKRL